MGSWGSEIFDNDDAQDYLLGLMEELSSHVEDHISIESACLGSIPAAIEVMALLVKTWQTVPPKPNDIERWRTDFFQACREKISEKELSESEYYKNISASFNSLKTISEGFENEENNINGLHQTSDLEFQIGMEVIHPKFGEGKILFLEGEGALARGKVNFQHHGEKWLILSMSGLDIK